MQYLFYIFYLCFMKLKEFLESNPIINNAQLAKLMYPNIKSANTKLANKLAENVSGSGKQRITDKDLKEAISVLDDLCKKIQEFKKDVV